MPDTFTPEQIAQILEAFFAAVGTRQYIGMRYVPIFGRKDETSIEWDNSAPYEPLTVVLYQGNSFTSRQYVPAGVEITNQEFWALTFNFNAQVELYRRETARALQVAEGAQGDIDTLLPKSDFSAENTVKNYIDETNALLPKNAFSAENTVKDFLDMKPFVFANVADMKNSDALFDGAVCITEGFNNSGDFGGAYYQINTVGDADEKSVFSCKNNLYAHYAYVQPFVTPEQFGAYGDGTHDDYEALQYAINQQAPVVGVNNYATTRKIVISNKSVKINTITYSGTDYAISIGNNMRNLDLAIYRISAPYGSGAILETEQISARLNVNIYSIGAYGGDAFTIVGGSGGVVESTFYGGQWVGKACGLRISPNTSFVGNLQFNHMRVNANDDDGTSLIIDSANGSITQLFFNDVSLEKESSNHNNNGIIINVVNNIEHMEGNFRVVELLEGVGKILTIKGTIQQQLQQSMHLVFDRLTPAKIDVSEVVMSRYFAINNPLAIIDSGQIYFSSEPQTQRIVIYGNRITLEPFKKTFVNVSSDYEFNEWDFPYSIFFATADVTIHIPTWLEPNKEIIVNPQGHTVSLKYTDFDGTEITATATGNNPLRVGIARNVNRAGIIYMQ